MDLISTFILTEHQSPLHKKRSIQPYKKSSIKDWLMNFISNRSREHDFIWQVFLTCLIALPVMYPLAWTGNELNYFALAKHHLDPGQFTELYAVNSHQLSKIATDIVMGLADRYLGLNVAWFLSRFVLMIGLAVAYVKMTRALRIEVKTACFALIFFLFVGHQTYFAGEWIFGGSEGKVFAYIFVMLAVGLVIQGRLLPVVVMLAVATYFHFLVGGFWAGALFIYLYLNGHNRKRLVLGVLGFTVLVIPMVWLLIYENKILPTPDVSGLEFTIDQIYSDIRNPHHVAPFKEGHFRWTGGFFFFLLFSGFLYLVKRRQSFWNSNFVLWVGGLHIYLIVALVVAWFDRDTQLLGKFYLFRPASFIYLLCLLILFDAVSKHWLAVSEKRLKIITGLFFLVAAGALAIKLPGIVRSSPDRLQRSLGKDEKQLVDWIRTNIPEGTVILIPESSGKPLNSMNFEQLIDRPTLVSWKFVPTTRYEIALWYKRILLKHEIYEGKCDSIKLLNVSHVLTVNSAQTEKLSLCGEPLYSSGSYVLFTIH